MLCLNGEEIFLIGREEKGGEGSQWMLLEERKKTVASGTILSEGDLKAHSRRFLFSVGCPPLPPKDSLVRSALFSTAFPLMDS